MSNQSPFIVIEALDAGGSQTQTNLLSRNLKRAGFKVLQLHFPQEDRASGRLIYDKLLLSKKMGELSRREQAIFYLADFYSRLEDIVKHLAGVKKRAVVSDRFFTSTLAYQTIGLTGSARKKMITWLKWLCLEGVPSLPQPDLVIFLDTPVEVSLKRLRHKKKDFFETREKLTAIRNSYLKIAAEEGWAVLASLDENGQEKSKREQQREVWTVVQSKLG